MSKSATKSGHWLASPSACEDGRCDRVLGRQGGTAGLQLASMPPENVLPPLRPADQTGLPKRVEVRKPPLPSWLEQEKIVGF